jgi:hypothetical protein
MDDRDGTPFCDDCAEDASETGLFSEVNAEITIDPNADCLCCDYKTCRHTCTEDDPCTACVGRGDCGFGHQTRVGETKPAPRIVANMQEQRDEVSDSLRDQINGGIVGPPLDTPRIVAECWTCRPSWQAPLQLYDAVYPLENACRALGHDVRPVKVQS